MSTEETLLEIIGHLSAAKMQRAPSDDKIIAEHIDAALAIATKLRRDLNSYEPPDPPGWEGGFAENH